FISRFLDLLYLISFPTRRSSDLYKQRSGGYYTNTAYYYSDTSFDLFTFHCCYDLLAWYCSLIVLFSTWSRMDRVASFHGCTGNTRTDSTLCVCFPCITKRGLDRKSTGLNSNNVSISYAFFCLN